jgi:thiol-disulfide isomerase/thioredoxin
LTKSHKSKPQKSATQKHDPQKSEPQPKRLNYRLLGIALVMGAALLIVGYKVLGSRSAPPPATDNPAELIEWAESNKKPALIVYHSTNCVPCIKMGALVEAVRKDYEPKVTFVDVLTNVEANIDLVQEAGIRSIPTSDFLSVSGEKNRVVGLMAEEHLRSELARLAAGK